MATTVIGQACHEWDYDARQCARSIDVLCLTGGHDPFFVSKLAVDADGAPRAYHPGDTDSYDYLANLNVNDLHGIQGQDGAVGPAPGFYISGTSLTNPAHPANDTRCYVDASTIPYFVLSGGAFPSVQGHKPLLGCVAMVVDLTTGRGTGAIYADNGRAVGEGSIALAVALGLDPISHRHPPKVVGFDGIRFLYIVFPDQRVAPPWDPETIRQQARVGFTNWGGAARVAALYPGHPPVQV